MLSYSHYEKRRAHALELMQIGLTAIEPRRVTRQAIRQLQGELNLEGCTVFAFGKAALGMAQGLLDEIKPQKGIVHCFEQGQLGPLKLVKSAHPMPATDAAQRGRELYELAQTLMSDEIAICLVSGGGSAMLEYPKPGISMAYIKKESDRLMKAGATINVLNARRMELSAIKNGGLAQAIRPAKVITILMSDTPGAPLETVASGPTLPSDRTIIAADHLTLQKAILSAEPSLRPLPTLLAGEARVLGASLAQQKAGFIATGETTVSVVGQGRGGRNHELILGALQYWRHKKQSNGLLLSIGTDGIDGSSDAAGAFCDEEILTRAPDPTPSLLHNDAHHYFKALDAQIKTGPTGSNVADLVISLP